MSQPTRAAARQLLAFVGDAQTLGLAEPFTTELLDRLAVLMRCDFATYYEFDLVGRLQYGYVACSHEARYEAAPPEPSWEPAEKTRVAFRPGPVQMWSDIHNRAARRRFETTSWARGFEVVDSAWTLFRSKHAKQSTLVLHSHDRDFGERDREALLLLRPHVFALIRDSRARRRLDDLLASTNGAGDEPRGFLLLDGNLQIEHASPAARRILEAWFGNLERRLPAALDDWRRADPLPGQLWIEGAGKRLVVEAPTKGAVVLTEEERPPAVLTPRELDVLRCLAAGNSTAETARLLWVTPATVSKHLEHIYRKLGVTSRTAALAVMRRSLRT